MEENKDTPAPLWFLSLRPKHPNRTLTQLEILDFRDFERGRSSGHRRSITNGWVPWEQVRGLHVKEIGVVKCDVFGVEPWDHRGVDGVDRFGHRESRWGSLRVVERVFSLGAAGEGEGVLVQVKPESIG